MSTNAAITGGGRGVGEVNWRGADECGTGAWDEQQYNCFCCQFTFTLLVNPNVALSRPPPRCPMCSLSVQRVSRNAYSGFQIANPTAADPDMERMQIMQQRLTDANGMRQRLMVELAMLTRPTDENETTDERIVEIRSSDLNRLGIGAPSVTSNTASPVRSTISPERISRIATLIGSELEQVEALMRAQALGIPHRAGPGNTDGTGTPDEITDGHSHRYRPACAR
jgi:hypothetical protein